MADDDTNRRLTHLEREIAALKEHVGGIMADTAPPHPGSLSRHREVDETRMMLAQIRELMARIDAKLDEPYLSSSHGFQPD